MSIEPDLPFEGPNTHTPLSHARELVDRTVGQVYRRNPYVVLAGAAGLGYLLAGGLFSPFTRRILRMGMRAMVLPLAATQLKQITQLNPASAEESP